MNKFSIPPFVSALVIAALSFWLFKDTLSYVLNDKMLIEKALVDRTVIVVGRKEPCKAEIRLPVWKAMNDLQVYRWVVECEDALKLDSSKNKATK